MYMVFIASFISIFIGLILGALLFTTAKNQTFNNLVFNRTLGFIANVIRSLPFIILMISIIPLTRLLAGTTIGTNAAIVPLAIAAIPFFARICENAFAEVSPGLIEAAHAMGASSWQIITKVLLPESLPALIRGATLTIIGLVGYSAMAGVIGGGGLGELAINYGYQRFDTVVMLETVIILIAIVQLIQVIGDRLARQRHIKIVLFTGSALMLAAILFQVGLASFQIESSLRVGVVSGLNEKVMQVAAKVAKKEYGINLQVIAFSDYVQPNTALNNHSIDANIFQHVPYFQAQIKAHHYKLIAIAKTFVYPMGFYSQKISEISELKDGAVIAMPNDPSNGSRALLILQKYGFIQLKPNAGVLATVNDIIANPHHLKFILLDAAQLPRVLDDADLVAITNDFIGPTGLTVKQALLKEGGDSPYANIIAVREQDKNNPTIRKFVEVMHSEPVRKITNELFPNGGAISAWDIK